VRLTDTAGYLTIKGKSVGATRAEFEYEIPMEDARQLLDQFAVSDVTKTRYNIPLGAHVWEVDVFAGDNEGLVVAEIELFAEEEVFEKPQWIAEEVTGDAKYYNSSLSTHPFSRW